MLYIEQTYEASSWKSLHNINSCFKNISLYNINSCFLNMILWKQTKCKLQGEHLCTKLCPKQSGQCILTCYQGFFVSCLSWMSSSCFLTHLSFYAMPITYIHIFPHSSTGSAWSKRAEFLDFSHPKYLNSSPNQNWASV